MTLRQSGSVVYVNNAARREELPRAKTRAERRCVLGAGGGEGGAGGRRMIVTTERRLMVEVVEEGRGGNGEL